MDADALLYEALQQRPPKTIHWVMDLELAAEVRSLCAQVENHTMSPLEATDRLRSLPTFPIDWNPGDHLEMIVVTGQTLISLPTRS